MYSKFYIFSLTILLITPIGSIAECVDPDGDGYGLNGDRPCRTRRVRSVKQPSTHALSVSNVRVSSITGNSAEIKSDFSEPASGKILFGKTKEFGKFGAYQLWRKDKFSQSLKNLEPDTTYFFKVEARNGRKLAYSDIIEFRTSGVPDSTVVTTTTKPSPVVKLLGDPTHDAGTNDVAISFAFSDYSEAQLEYGKNKSSTLFGIKEDSFTHKTHTQKLKNLDADTRYEFRIHFSGRASNSKNLVSEWFEFTTDKVKEVNTDGSKPNAGSFSIVNPLDSSDPRYMYEQASEQMSYGPCPWSPSPSGEGCMSHVVERPPHGNGLSGGIIHWSLDEIEGDEVYMSWWQRFENRNNVGQPTKLYGLAAKKTVGYSAFKPGKQTKAQWEAKYAAGVGGQAGGAGGWYHGAKGVNGLGHAWSARMVHSGGFGFTNTGQINVETYHTDSNNFLEQNGATRQFGENIGPFTKPRRVGIDRIRDNGWHHYCMRVKLNSLSSNPRNGINRDGILQVFVDQNLVVNRKNLHFTEDPAYRDFRAYLVVFGGGDTVNTENWETYTSGLRYSPTECVVAKR